MLKKLKTLKKGFTLVEVLVVVIVLGILSSVVVLKVDQSLTRSLSRKANSDVTLLNNAITQWRSSYPSVDFATQVNNNSASFSPPDGVASSDEEYAFALISPFLSLPTEVNTLVEYNSDTAKLFSYQLNGTNTSFVLAVPAASP